MSNSVAVPAAHVAPCRGTGVVDTQSVTWSWCGPLPMAFARYTVTDTTPLGAVGYNFSAVDVAGNVGVKAVAAANLTHGTTLDRRTAGGMCACGCGYGLDVNVESVF